jgi:hypothetical protein
VVAGNDLFAAIEAEFEADTVSAFGLANDAQLVLKAADAVDSWGRARPAFQLT